MKSAARNNWSSILAASGVGSEYLTGDHAPCPKCGGTDRFRFTNQEGDGSAICNQCLKAGDGISVLQWWTGQTIPECIKFVAEFLRLPEPEKKKQDKKRTLEDAFVPSGPLNESGMAMFCGFNAGITEVGVNRAGGIMGNHYSQHLLGFPAVDQSLEKVVNYVVMSATGKHCKHFPKGSNKFELVRKKTVVKGAGLLGGEAIDFLKTSEYVEVCWKVEGPTSMLALMSVIPDNLWGRHIVVSNVFGAGERPSWMAEVLAQKCQQVYVVPDLDEVGSESGKNWANAIARAGGQVKIVTLPYQAADKKDMRDYVQEHGAATIGHLLDLASNSQSAKTPEVPARRANTDIPSADRQVLDDLEMDVLFEGADGTIEIYCVATSKTDKIKRIDQLKYERLLQMAGIPVRNYVAAKAEEAEPHQHTLSQVKRAIAMAASVRRVQDAEAAMLGAGIWPEVNAAGDRTGCVVCCNNRSLSVLDANGIWSEVNSPRYGSMLFRLDGDRWFDHEHMGKMIEKAKDPAWCLEQLTYIEQLIDRWPWGRAIDSQVLTGLVGSTFCQTAWRWRPLVSIRGASRSGKSHWDNFLFGNSANRTVGVFGKLAFSSALSSPAGIRQTIRGTSRAVAIDEWDSYNGRRRQEMLQMLRTSGPGTKVTMGTSSHKAVQFALNHICWLLGVEVAMEEEMDANRVIEFEISMSDKSKRDAYREPTQEERNLARDAMAAIAIVHGLRASQLAQRIESAVETRLDKRVRNSLCVPAAFLAASAGLDDSEAAKIAQAFCDAVSGDHEEIESRENQLLQDLFALNVQMGTSRYTVAEVLAGNSFCESNPEHARQVASTLGVSIHHIDDRKHLAIHPRTVVKALRDDRITAAGLRQNLLRIPGSFKHRCLVAVGNVNVVLIPWGKVKEIALGDEPIEAF